MTKTKYVVLYVSSDGRKWMTASKDDTLSKVKDEITKDKTFHYFPYSHKFIIEVHTSKENLSDKDISRAKIVHSSNSYKFMIGWTVKRALTWFNNKYQESAKEYFEDIKKNGRAYWEFPKIGDVKFD